MPSDTEVIKRLLATTYKDDVCAIYKSKEGRFDTLDPGCMAQAIFEVENDVESLLAARGYGPRDEKLKHVSMLNRLRNDIQDNLSPCHRLVNESGAVDAT